MSVAEILSKNSFLILTPNNRIKCNITGHEMPVRYDVIHDYLNSKAFKKAHDWYSFDFSCFLPHIIPDKSSIKRLYCKLTKKRLNKIPEEIQRHVSGKNFKRLLEEFNAKGKSKGGDTNTDADAELEDENEEEDDDEDEEDASGEGVEEEEENSVDDLMGDPDSEEEEEEEEVEEAVTQAQRTDGSRSRGGAAVGNKRARAASSTFPLSSAVAGSKRARSEAGAVPVAVNMGAISSKPLTSKNVPKSLMVVDKKKSKPSLRKR